MGKIIAVWGTPNSGKTAFTMKLAGHLYETGRRRQTKVVAVLTDVIAPSIHCNSQISVRQQWTLRSEQ